MDRRLSPVVKVFLVLVAVWVAMGVIGFVIRGLFWLFVIALIAFGFTLAGGARRSRLFSRR